ncbi:DUF4142 domain-containing protein [Verrucomicrobiota bacterium sgz303538]
MTKHRFPFAKSLAAFASVILVSVANAQPNGLTHEDKEFLKNASELNLTEIELGRLAQERADTPEIRDVGSRMAADHGKAQAELQALAKSKGVTIRLEPNAGQRKLLNAFAGKSGPEFDREFRAHEAKDHERAIRSFTEAARDARDPEVRAYAEKLLPGMQQHHAMVSEQGPSKRTTETRTEARRPRQSEVAPEEKERGRVRTE